MNKVKLAIISLAAGVVAAGTASAAPVAKAAAGVAQPHNAQIVQVRHGGPHHFRGGGVRHFDGGMHHRHFRHHRFWGPRVYFYGNYGGGGCWWLKEKALDTGSRYWWRRYQACRNGW